MKQLVVLLAILVLGLGVALWRGAAASSSAGDTPVEVRAASSGAPPAPAGAAPPRTGVVAPRPAARATDLLDVLQQPHPDAATERAAFDEALAASGPPEAWAADASARVDELIAALAIDAPGIVVRPTACRQAGCLVELVYRDPSAYDDTRRLRDLRRIGDWPGGTVQTAPVQAADGSVTHALILLPPPPGK